MQVDFVAACYWLQVTMIREYCQGPDAVCYNLPTGGFDGSKHKSIEDCVRAELSEEVSMSLSVWRIHRACTKVGGEGGRRGGRGRGL